MESYGRLSKLGSFFVFPLQYSTYYLGYPKRDHNCDNYPYIESMVLWILGPSGAGVLPSCA